LAKMEWMLVFTCPMSRHDDFRRIPCKKRTISKDYWSENRFLAYLR
jgi:hypothetical protein